MPILRRLAVSGCCHQQRCSPATSSIDELQLPPISCTGRSSLEQTDSPDMRSLRFAASTADGVEIAGLTNAGHFSRALKITLEPGVKQFHYQYSPEPGVTASGVVTIDTSATSRTVSVDFPGVGKFIRGENGAVYLAVSNDFNGTLQIDGRQITPSLLQVIAPIIDQAPAVPLQPPATVPSQTAPVQTAPTELSLQPTAAPQAPQNPTDPSQEEPSGTTQIPPNGQAVAPSSSHNPDTPSSAPFTSPPVSEEYTQRGQNSGSSPQVEVAPLDTEVQPDESSQATPVVRYTSVGPIDLEVPSDQELATHLTGFPEISALSRQARLLRFPAPNWLALAPEAQAQQITDRLAQGRSILDEFTDANVRTTAISTFADNIGEIDAAIDARRADLSRQMRVVGPSSEEFAKISSELKELVGLEDKLRVGMFEQLEKQIRDPSISADLRQAAQEQLLRFRDELRQSIARQSVTTETLTATRPTLQRFDELVREARGATQSRFRQMVGRVSDTYRRWVTSSTLNPEINISRLWQRTTPTAPAAQNYTTLLEGELFKKGVGELDTADTTKHYRELDRALRDTQSRMRQLESRLSQGAGEEIIGEMQKLREMQAKIAIRAHDVLEQRINRAPAGSAEAARLQSQLYERHGSVIESALSDEARTRFSAERQQYQIAKTNTHFSFTDPVRLARGEVRRLERQIGAIDESAPAAQKTRVALGGQLEVAKTRVAVAEASEYLNQLRNQNPNYMSNPTQALAIAEAEMALAFARIDEQTAVVSLMEQGVSDTKETIARLTQELDEGNLTSAQRSTKTAYRDQFQAAADRLTRNLQSEEAQLRRAIHQGGLAESSVVVREAELQLSELTQGTDDYQKQAQQVATERASLQELRQRYFKSEVDVIEQQIRTVRTELAELGERQTARHRSLSRRIVELERQKADFDFQLKKVDLEISVARLPELEARLATMEPTAEGRALLVEEIQKLKVEETELRQMRQTFRQRYQQAMTAARETVGRLSLAELNLRNPNSLLHTRIEAPGRFIQRNPLGSMMLIGGLTEAVGAWGQADLDDDAVHTYLPSSLYLFERPLEGWIDEMEFTTAEGGEMQAQLADAVSRGGDVATMVALFYAGQKTIELFPGGARATALLGRAGGPLMVGGSGLYGFSEFYDYDSWKDDTDTQLAFRTGTPIISSAVGAGMFFGPVGAGIGAVAGGIGEAAGVTYALAQFEYGLETQWKERSVRDSIRAAIDGFVLPESDPRVRRRDSTLSAEEESVIDAYTKELVLRRIFTPGQPDSFTPDQLRAAGFIPSGTGGNEQETGQHNWNRLLELMDDIENNYNPLTTWTHFDQLESSDPDLAEKFDGIVNESRNYYQDLYRRAMRVDYQREGGTSALGAAGNELFYGHWASPGRYFFSRESTAEGTVETDSELKEYITEVANAFELEFKQREQAATTEEQRIELAEEQWQYLFNLENPGASRFPGLATILGNPDTRTAFLNRFTGVNDERQSLTEYSMWHYISESETGWQMLQGPLRDLMIQEMTSDAFAVSQ